MCGKLVIIAALQDMEWRKPYLLVRSLRTSPYILPYTDCEPRGQKGFSTWYVSVNPLRWHKVIREEHDEMYEPERPARLMQEQVHRALSVLGLFCSTPITVIDAVQGDCVR